MSSEQISRSTVARRSVVSFLNWEIFVELSPSSVLSFSKASVALSLAAFANFLTSCFFSARKLRKLFKSASESASAFSQISTWGRLSSKASSTPLMKGSSASSKAFTEALSSSNLSAPALDMPSTATASRRALVMSKSLEARSCRLPQRSMAAFRDFESGAGAPLSFASRAERTVLRVCLASVIVLPIVSISSSGGCSAFSGFVACSATSIES
mmetsp:Transcript_48029/g.102930  ORF Transcript_48029/g.102930 Transcript_48029/m.102930 type:complete len:213 (+) Transcript_48029:3000-3638(+)